MTCERLDLQDALLKARARGDRPGRVESEHLDGCADCRRAVELFEQVREHWDDDLPNIELLHLRLRVLPLLSKRSKRLAARRGLRAHLPAFVTAAAVASVAAAGTYYAVRGRAPANMAESATPSSPGSVGDSPDAGVTPGPITPQPPLPSTQSFGAPAPVDVGARHATAAPRRRALDTPPQPSGRTSWLEAAEALKQSDTGRAERALGELTSSGDAVTRDSAELALVELWIKKGQEARSRAVLARLAVSGATPAIRSRARALALELDR
jgi:hypothetical protein